MARIPNHTVFEINSSMKNAPNSGDPSETTTDLFAGWRWPLATIALLVFAFFSRFLLTGRFFLMRDLIFDFFARKQFYKNHLLSGELPLWNPYTGGGEPFLSNLESAVFYPPNLLNLLFPVPTANVILATLHVGLAGFGVWLACRAWRVSQQGSVLAAISFAFSTQMVTRIEFSSFLCSLSWYPLAVALFTLWLKKPSLRKFLLLAMVLCLQFLGGYPEAVLFTAGTLVLYALVVGGRARLAGKKRITRTGLALLGLAGMGIIAILLSLAQILPVLNIVRFSVRATQNPLAEQASVNPAMWLTALFPYLYGVPGYFGKYWAPACMEFWMGTFYVGLLPVMLCVTVLIRRSLGGRQESGDFATDDPVARLRTPFLLVILIFFMLYAMGNFTPFFGFLWKIVLPLRWFRWPGKALMVVSFALCCLGGIAFDCLARQGDARGQQSAGWRQRLADYGPLALWLALAAMAGACLADLGRLYPWVLRSFFNLGSVAEQYSHRLPWEILTNDLLKFLLVAVLAAILIQLYIVKPEKRRATFWVMVLVLFADLFVTTYPLLPSSSLDIMHNTSDYKTSFRSGKLEGRFFRSFSQQYNYGSKNETLLRLARDTMAGYWAMVDKVQNIRPGGDFKLKNYMDLFSNAEFDLVPEPYKTKVFKLLGATYILESALKPGYFEGDDIDTPKMYALAGAVPEAVVVGRAEGFATWEYLLSALIYGQRDLSKVALLEADDLAQIGPLSGSGPVEHEIIDYANRLNGLTVKVKSAEPGILVINATFYPSWVATVNGEETPIYQANGPFRAVKIPAGNSVVEMDFHPWRMLIGLYLSLGCLTIVLGMFFMADRISWFREPKKPASG
jgi:hypothetical protein